MRVSRALLGLFMLAVYLSGVCEIVLGVLLFAPCTRRLAAWGIIALLIAVFPANIHVYQHQELFPISPVLHLLRLPLQAVLLLWAFRHIRRRDLADCAEPPST